MGNLEVGIMAHICPFPTPTSGEQEYS